MPFISTSGGTTQPKVLAHMGGKKQFRSSLKSVFLMKWVFGVITPPAKTISQREKVHSFDSFTAWPSSLMHSLLFLTHSPPLFFLKWAPFSETLGSTLGVSACVRGGGLPPLQHFAQNKTQEVSNACLYFQASSRLLPLFCSPDTGCLPFQWTT